MDLNATKAMECPTGFVKDFWQRKDIWKSGLSLVIETQIKDKNKPLKFHFKLK